MPAYQNSEQLLTNLRLLFDQIAREDGNAVDVIARTRLIIRLSISDPELEILVNGRKNPVEITYGQNRLRPDLDIRLSADVLHDILLKKRSLKGAFTSGEVKVRGQLIKSFVMEDLFRRGQELYPEIWEASV